MKTIIIDPVTRIEGHAKITIDLNEDGSVEDARLHVTQYRGFEKFCEGKIYTDMPALTARTCGICPVSHVISSSKACDTLLSVTPPKAAINIRKIVNLAQIIQSHTLNFYHLSSPDFVYGFDAQAFLNLGKGVTMEGLNPAVKANFLGMVEEYGTSTGKSTRVNDGFRTSEKQAALKAL